MTRLQMKGKNNFIRIYHEKCISCGGMLIDIAFDSKFCSYMNGSSETLVTVIYKSSAKDAHCT